MSIVKAHYHNGKIEFIEKPLYKDNTNVFVIFPDKKKENCKLRGSVKSSHPIDYKQIAEDLRKLSSQSEAHIAEELNQESGNDE